MAARNCLSIIRRAQVLHHNVNYNTNTAVKSLNTKQQLWRLYSSSEKSATKEQTVDSASNDTTTAAIDPAAFEKMRADLESANKKYEELLDKYKRALADSENMRMRLEKRAAEAKIFGIQSFGKDLLEVADNLQHATAAVPKEELQKNVQLKNLYDGLTMTQASLLQIFKRHGLEPMNPLNSKFDPNFHEALFMKADSSVEPNTVIEVTKVGYKLHERCIRPALVGVSKAS